MSAYERPGSGAVLWERIEAVREHFTRMPCPGCLDARDLLAEYRICAAELDALKALKAAYRPRRKAAAR